MLSENYAYNEYDEYEENGKDEKYEVYEEAILLKQGNLRVICRLNVKALHGERHSGKKRKLWQMTVRLSPQKVAKIMRCYFKGMPQPDIAEKAGVDQSTVSLYASRFKDAADEIGLLSAGKEFGVFNEVSSLRSLSVELSKADLTVEEAKQGLNIIKAFSKLGVKPEEHSRLVRVCREVNDPGFIQAANRLNRIENENNMTYEEAMSKFQSALSSLPLAEKELEEVRSKLKAASASLAEKHRKLKELEVQITQLESGAKRKAAKIEQELTMKMKQLRVKQTEVEEIARLKAELDKEGLDIETLVRLAKEFKYGTSES